MRGKSYQALAGFSQMKVKEFFCEDGLLDSLVNPSLKKGPVERMH